MTLQIASNTLLDQFRKQGVTRKSPSFFGKMLNQSPAASMLAAFKQAGVVRNQSSFFGQSLDQATPLSPVLRPPIPTAP